MEEAPQIELGRPLSEGIRAALLRVTQTQPKDDIEQLEFALLYGMLAKIMQDPSWKQEGQKLLENGLISQKEDGSFIFDNCDIYPSNIFFSFH